MQGKLFLLILIANIFFCELWHSKQSTYMLTLIVFSSIDSSVLRWKAVGPPYTAWFQLLIYHHPVTKHYLLESSMIDDFDIKTSIFCQTISLTFDETRGYPMSYIACCILFYPHELPIIHSIPTVSPLSLPFYLHHPCIIAPTISTSQIHVPDISPCSHVLFLYLNLHQFLNQ